MADIQVYQRVIDYTGLNVRPVPERSLVLFKDVNPVLALLQGMGPDGAQLLTTDGSGHLVISPQGSSVYLNSNADLSAYAATMDFQRRMAVNQPPDWWIYPVGRIIYQDTFEDALLKWSQALGTVARDTTTAHYGGASVKLTTGAVAGNQAIARKFFIIPADEGYQRSVPIAARSNHIIIGCWFRQLDVNLRDFYIRLKADDTFTSREWWLRFHRRQVGVNQNTLEYLNSAGNFVSVGTYPIDDTVNYDIWNFLAMELDYMQGADGAGGYGYYRSARLSDMIWKPTPGTIPSWQTATGGLRQSLVDIQASTDVAVATSAYADDFMYTDLNWASNQ